MKRRVDENELLQRIADLPREIAPGNDPWAAIAARIESRASKRRSYRFAHGWALRAAAASLVLALTAAVLLGPRLSGPGAPEPTIDVAASGEAVTAAASTLPTALAASEAEYRAAFREFIAVGQARASLSVQTIATIETGWADLREAESALAAALARNPDDRFLNRRMLELRARQLGFLQELAALDQSNRRLTI
jgi:hypothetical protein